MIVEGGSFENDLISVGRKFQRRGMNYGMRSQII